MDEEYFYVKDGVALQGCIEKIGNAYYGFDDKGRMWAGTEFRNAYCYYRAKSNGSLYINEWYKDGDEYYYYGKEGKKYEDGLYEINGKWYKFYRRVLCKDVSFTTTDGVSYYCDLAGNSVKLENNKWTNVKQTYFYVKNGVILKDCIEKIGNRYYGFDSVGKMYAGTEFRNGRDYYRAKSDGSLYVNELYKDDNNTMYYYGEEGKQYSGFVTVGDKQYWCDTDGKATELFNNKWTKVDETYFYVKNGKILKNCVEKIGNAYYAFGIEGKMIEDGKFYFRNYETHKIDWYCAKKNGKLYVNEWYEDNWGKWYYCGKEGKLLYSDFQIIEGKQYWCDGSGRATEVKNNEWTKVEESYCYLKDGIILKNCVKKNWKCILWL